MKRGATGNDFFAQRKTADQMGVVIALTTEHNKPNGWSLVVAPLDTWVNPLWTA
jgi:hypothetical protein